MLKEILIEKTTENFGEQTKYKSGNLTVLVQRMEKLDKNGNPRYIIAPAGYLVDNLPTVQGYRKNNIHKWYTTQSYNIDEEVKLFFERANNLKLYQNYTVEVEFKA